jgi:hypothetical protein
MGQWVNPTDPCDPSSFGNPFDPLSAVMPGIKQLPSGSGCACAGLKSLVSCLAAIGRDLETGSQLVSAS